MIASALLVLVVLWTAMQVIFASVLVRRTMSRRPAPASAMRVRGLLLVRPCAGLEPFLEQTLSSSRAVASVASDVRVVFAAAQEDDPALPVAEEVARQLRAEGLDVSVSITRPRGLNAKSGQLAAVCRDRPANIVMCADSDVLLTERAAQDLMGALGEKAAAAWAPPVEGVPRTLGDRLSHAVLTASYQSFPLLAAIDDQAFVGKLFAVRQASLRRAGGFEAASHAIGDDVALARRLRGDGGRIAVSPTPVTASPRARRVGDVVERYARWIQVVRERDPRLLVAYPLLFLATAPALVACACLASTSPGLSLLLGLALVGARFAVALAGRAAAALPLSPGRSLCDAFVADAVLAIALLRGTTRNQVNWRGRVLRVERHALGP